MILGVWTTATSEVVRMGASRRQPGTEAALPWYSSASVWIDGDALPPRPAAITLECERPTDCAESAGRCASRTSIHMWRSQSFDPCR